MKPLALMLMFLLALTIIPISSAPAFAAQQDKIPVIVMFKHYNKAHQMAAMQALGGVIKRSYKIIPGYAADLTPDAIAKLKKDPDIAAIDPDIKVHAFDSSANTQIRADQVVAAGDTGQGVKVAILDTGIDNADGEFTGRILQCHDEFDTNISTCFDDHGHGTHVAGIIGATGVNPAAKGVAPGVSYLIDKVLDSTGGGSISGVIAGIEWAVSNNAQVISMSLGGTTNNPGQPNCDNDNTSLTTAINTAVAAGVTVVAAAGNIGQVIGVATPGCISSVIAVGAVDSTDHIATFSETGPAMTDHGISAPGVSILSTVPLACSPNPDNLCNPSGYVRASGTSMATPHVAGTVALLLQTNPSLSPATIRNILFSTACKSTTSPSCPTGGVPNTTFGSGRVDALRAFDSILSFIKTLPDSVTMLDSISTVTNFARSLPDSVSVSDQMSTATNFKRDLPDSVSVSDSMSTATNFKRDLPDSATILDSVSTSQGFARSLPDSVSVSDQMSTATNFKRDLPDSVAISDSVMVIAITLSLSPGAGSPSSTVHITGTNFVPTSTVTIKFDGIAQPTTPATVTSDGTGSFSATFSVPASFHGTHTVIVTDGTRTGFAPFVVTPPIISLSPTSGKVNDLVTVSGSGFDQNSPISITYGTTKVNPTTSASTNAAGSFTVKFYVPSSTGANVVTATDSSHNTASQTFTISQIVTLIPNTGAPGNTITVAGLGFNPTSTITIKFDGVTQATIPSTVTSDASGRFTGTITVPSSIHGIHTVSATDGVKTFSAPFAVSGSISSSPSLGSPSTSVTVTGVGYAPSSRIVISFGGNPMTTSPAIVTTDGLGQFTGTITAPTTTLGTKTVQATDASHNTASTTFTVARPTITLSPSSGNSGILVTVRGTNFVPGSSITIKFDNTNVTPGSITVDVSGQFTATITIPTSNVGTHTVSVTDTHNTSVAVFTRS